MHHYEGSATRSNRKKEKKRNSKDPRVPGIYKLLEGECSDDKKWKMVRGGQLTKLTTGKRSIKQHPSLAASENAEPGRREREILFRKVQLSLKWLNLWGENRKEKQIEMRVIRCLTL